MKLICFYFFVNLWTTYGSGEYDNIALKASQLMDKEHSGRSFPYEDGCSRAAQSSRNSDCLRLLYLPIRINKEATCSSQYNEYVACQRAAAKKCLLGGSTAAELAQQESRIEELSSQFRRKLLCEDGGFARIVPLPLTKGCTPNFSEEMKKCTKPFHDAYDFDKADESLCRLHETTLRCISKTTKHLCTAFGVGIITQLLRQKSAKSANPFCVASK